MGMIWGTVAALSLFQGEACQQGNRCAQAVAPGKEIQPLRAPLPCEGSVKGTQTQPGAGASSSA